MGNSLLDFVMALVRDPQAAARYAADPAGTLSTAGLPGVTVTDVQNLIPVVTDSLAATTPSFGDAFEAANVWTGSAAAAAFDAFHLPHPGPVVHMPLPHVSVGSIGAPAADAAPYPPVGEPFVDVLPASGPAAAGPLEHPTVDPVGGDWAGDEGWHPAHDLPPDHWPTDHPGFDLL